MCREPDSGWHRNHQHHVRGGPALRARHETPDPVR